MQRISPTLFQLVNQLNNLQIHSGESLAKTLKISRNAVWKHIQQLLKYDIDVSSLHGQGYQLKEPLNLLESIQFSSLLVAPGISIQQIEIYGSIASTNDEVRALPKPRENHLVFCLAEHQTQGRGRFERKWISPFGKNIMLSARVFLNKDMSSLGGLSLAISLAIRKTIEDLGIPGARCKWPNDIYYCDKKLSGVLIEAYAESHGLTELVIGIGLNVNMVHSTKTESIGKPWTSFQEITSMPHSRTKIALKLIENLSAYLKRFLDHSFENFSDEWKTHDFLKDQFIRLKIGNDEISGVARGTDSLGHLKMEDSEGKIKTYSAGEASCCST